MMDKHSLVSLSHSLRVCFRNQFRIVTARRARRIACINSSRLIALCFLAHQRRRKCGESAASTSPTHAHHAHHTRTTGAPHARQLRARSSCLTPATVAGCDTPPDRSILRGLSRHVLLPNVEILYASSTLLRSTVYQLLVI